MDGDVDAVYSLLRAVAHVHTVHEALGAVSTRGTDVVSCVHRSCEKSGRSWVQLVGWVHLGGWGDGCGGSPWMGATGAHCANTSIPLALSAGAVKESISNCRLHSDGYPVCGGAVCQRLRCPGGLAGGFSADQELSGVDSVTMSGEISKRA